MDRSVAVIAAHYPGAVRAARAVEELDVWIARSTQRQALVPVQMESPKLGLFIVVCVVPPGVSNVNAVARRLKKAGGRLLKVPEPSARAILRKVAELEKASESILDPDAPLAPQPRGAASDPRWTEAISGDELFSERSLRSVDVHRD